MVEETFWPMVSGDYELDKALMCRAIGKAVVDFVHKTGERSLRVTAICDEPEVTYDEEGTPHHGTAIRVYLDIDSEEEDDD